MLGGFSLAKQQVGRDDGLSDLRGTEGVEGMHVSLMLI